jgi:uncharacterized protein
MSPDYLVREILENNKIVAVYGMSTNPDKPAHYVPVFLQKHGYTIIPINPTVSEVAGLQSYPNLMAAPEPIEILDIFRPSAAALEVIKEAIARHQARGDIGVIWLQKGIVNDEARELAEEAGITFVQDKCMKEQYEQLFTE